MLPVVWSARAEEDLLSIIEFVGERDPWAAERLGDAIRESTWPLPEHPHLFRPGRVLGTREIVVHPNYIIVYRVELVCIKVLNVLHARQEYP
ncbi:type II toxin-antitoxin system RelE/ParE family toxin [Thauera sp.]|uniref:type II toxin-antitoxin system RelE/ParE family toxin n=1 Tax=Thauera sp. TaxID=1905334 RepID=UPI0039E2CDA5